MVQKHPIPITTVFPLAGADITISILQYMDVNSLISLRHTTSSGDQWAAWELQTRFIALLAPFISDPLSFRSTMHLTDTILSGVEILHFFYPSIQFTANLPLNLYTPYHFYQAMIYHFVGKEDYTITEQGPHLSHRSTIQHSSNRAVGRYACLAKGDKQIYILESLYSTPIPPILSSANTAAQGYISGTSFCHPYPSLTSQHRALLNPYFWGLEEGYDANLELLKEHLRSSVEWELAKRPTAWEDIGGCTGGPLSALCASALRYYGDKHCMYGRMDSLKNRFLFLHHDALNTYAVYYTRGGYVCTPSCHPSKTLIEAYLRVTLAECVSPLT